MYKNLSKILKCLSIKNKISFCILLFCNFISSFLEILSFGLIFPLLSKILEFDGPFSFENNFYITYVKPLTILEVVSLIFLFFSAKNILVIIVSYFSFLLDKNLQIDFTKKLINTYIERFSEGNPLSSMATIVRNITVEIKHFQKMSSATFAIIQDFLYSCLVILFLINILDKNLFFFLISTILIVTSYYFFTRNLVKNFGLLTLYHNRKFYKNILEIFSLIKECFVFDKIDIFKNKLLSNLDISKTMDIKNRLTTVIIKPLFEVLMLIALILYLWIFGKENNYKETFVVLTVTMLVIFRLSPVIIRISNSINLVNYYKASLDKLYIYLKEEKKNKYKKNKKIKIVNIQLRNINFYFNKNNKIIKNFSLDITRKNKIILSGKSGVGKSTLIDILMGFKKQKSGNILLNNKNYEENISSYFSYVPQRPYILDNNLEDNITLFKEEANKIKLKKIISICDLTSLDKKYLNNRLSLGDNGSNISEGQKQKVGICRALYHEKEIYIFDEPTSNLDSKSEEKVIKNILNYLDKKIVIFITHNENNYKFFDKVVNLN
jgi:ABC-type bacteriocin/lantibiotic exporter with double-glycine peptidase domain